MGTPQIQQTPGGYEAVWTAEKVRISVSHVDRIKLRGRISVYDLSLKVGHQTIYEPTDLLLTGPRSRADLARNLSSRLNSKPWPVLIGQLCLGVIDLIEKGEPVSILSVSAEPHPPDYALHPLVVKGYSNILFGDPSAGKSLVAVTLAILLHTTVDSDLGLTVHETMRLLYLDWEADRATVEYALTCQCRGFGVDTPTIAYKHLWPPLATELDQVRTVIEQTGANCLIIDSLTQAAGAGEHDQGRAAATAFFQALGALGLTSIVLAHDQKSQTGKKSILGSQVFTALARNAWEVRKSQHPGEESARIALYHRKPPPFSGLCHPIGLRYDFDRDNHQTTISPCDVRDEPELITGMAASSRILELLKEGAMSSKDIAAALEISLPTVSAALSRLEQRSNVIHLKKEKRWGLLSSLSSES